MRNLTYVRYLKRLSGADLRSVWNESIPNTRISEANFNITSDMR